MMFNNLRELLDDYSAITPYHFGRNLYKYTDCGPRSCYAMAAKSIMVMKKPQVCFGVTIALVPETLFFPFTSERLDNVVQEINDEASYEWELANCSEDEDE